MLKQVHISYMLPVNPDLLKQIKYVCMCVCMYIKCSQFRDSTILTIARVISIHFFVVSAGDLAPFLNSGVSTRRELTF